MRVSRITLSAYRNYCELDLDTDADLCVFVGENAQGKTNLLEAIYYLATARSFRTLRDEELIKWGATHAGIAGTVEREIGEATIQVRIPRAGVKRVSVNGQFLRRQAELFGYLNVVTFSPDDLQLVKGSPSERRRFIDIELSQVSPTYRNDLIVYYRILRQRSNLLRDIADRNSGVQLLPAWDEQLVEIGSRVMVKRAEAVLRLSEAGSAVHAEITGGQEQLRIRYRPFFAVPGEEPPAAGAWEKLSVVRDRFSHSIERLRQAEIRRGQNLVGPQRDDLEFWINGRDVRSYGSQGQQRTAVLSCKMAEIEFMRSETGEYPVLLLDDVMSELDQKRRQFFLATVSGRVQTIITTTSLHSFSASILAKARVARIVAGDVQPNTEVS